MSVDLTADDALSLLPQRIRAHCDTLHLLFNAAGMLHAPGVAPEKSLLSLRREALDSVFALNAFAPILLAQALAPLMGHGAPAVFASLSARVGFIGDNRLGGWYAYRASKAAQNQLLRTLAVEWKRTHPHACVLTLHPGTVDTPLSRPFQVNVPEDKLFTPEHAARQLLEIVAAHHARRVGLSLHGMAAKLPGSGPACGGVGFRSCSCSRRHHRACKHSVACR